MASIFIGIVLGLIVGSIPIAIPGISSPVKLGLAGGPIIAGIVIGSYGPRLHLVTYTTRSASLMLEESVCHSIWPAWDLTLEPISLIQ